MWKPQFLKNIADDAYIEEYDDVLEYDDDEEQDSQYNTNPNMSKHISLKDMNDDQDGEHSITEADEPMSTELPVDVYQTPEEIVVRTAVAGVPPSNVDISLTRDMLTITCSRDEAKEVTEDDYFYKELYWGAFTRTITLPAEVDVDEASAQEKHGILTVRLPKINKDRQATIKVKSS